MEAQTDREFVGYADPGPLSVMTTPADRVARLAMDARYHLERRDLYAAKADGRDAVSPGRLLDLEQAYELAAERLVAAEAEPGLARTQNARGYRHDTI